MKIARYEMRLQRQRRGPIPAWREGFAQPQESGLYATRAEGPNHLPGMERAFGPKALWHRDLGRCPRLVWGGPLVLSKNDAEHHWQDARSFLRDKPDCVVQAVPEAARRLR